MKTTLHGLLISTALLLASATVFADEVVIIVHPSNPLTEISTDDVKKIYLGKKKFFPGGGNVIPGEQPSNTESHKFFYDSIIGKSETELRSYWSRRIFSGKGTPPKVIGYDRIVKERVASTPLAMGYIMRSEIDNTVKVLDLK
ncbi:MAG: phosphate ABC transporter substrate-binding protein [Gammaproteobacteria bacterium]|nr:phosphate ABC transporter substrate-binding protein [Gammaproteobacteria bacterium]